MGIFTPIFIIYSIIGGLIEYLICFKLKSFISNENNQGDKLISEFLGLSCETKSSNRTEFPSIEDSDDERYSERYSISPEQVKRLRSLIHFEPIDCNLILLDDPVDSKIDSKIQMDNSKIRLDDLTDTQIDKQADTQIDNSQIRLDDMTNFFTIIEQIDFSNNASSSLDLIDLFNSKIDEEIKNQRDLRKHFNQSNKKGLKKGGLNKKVSFSNDIEIFKDNPINIEIFKNERNFELNMSEINEFINNKESDELFDL